MNTEKQGHGSKMAFTKIDKNIGKVYLDLKNFDHDFFKFVIKWETQLSRIANLNWLDPLNISLIPEFIILYLVYLNDVGTVSKNLQSIKYRIGSVGVDIGLLRPIRFEKPQKSIREAYR